MLPMNTRGFFKVLSVLRVLSSLISNRRTGYYRGGVLGSGQERIPECGSVSCRMPYQDGVKEFERVKEVTKDIMEEDLV